MSESTLLHAMDVSPSERPTKRQRTCERDDVPSSSTSNDTMLTSKAQHHDLSSLPLPVLLLALPAILLHPPTHRNYTKSLHLSFLAALRCLAYVNLDPDMECRAWTALAELGFRMGLGEGGVEREVEVAITKGLLISQNHPTLRPYKVHLTLLSSRISSHQHKLKLSQTTLKRLLTAFLAPNDPPHLVYAAHLGYIASLSVPISSSESTPTPTPSSLKAIQDLHDAALSRGHADIVTLAAVLRLHALVQMGRWGGVREALGEAEGMVGVTGLFLGLSTSSNVPSGGAGKEQKGQKEKKSKDEAKEHQKRATLAFATLPRPPAHTAFLVYTLVLGLVYYAHTGEGEEAERRMGVLHDVMDSCGGGVGFGVVEIPFERSPPLHINTTHPRTLTALAFLVTAVAKRDPVGRRPKRRVFGVEGVGVVERELRGAVTLAPWASPQDVRSHFEGLERVKADLVCELVSVSIMRSEFVSAETHLAELIAHVRNVRVPDCSRRGSGYSNGSSSNSSGHYGENGSGGGGGNGANGGKGRSLWTEYAARITLLHAQLAHALGRTERAVGCYQVAAWLSRPLHERVSEGAASGRGECAPGSKGEDGSNREDDTGDEDQDTDGTPDPFIHASARLGEIWVRIGHLRREVAHAVPEDVDHERVRGVEGMLRGELGRVLGELGVGDGDGREGGMGREEVGSTLASVGAVLKACLTDEFLEAKTHLRTALTLASSSGDNHLRALLMALIAAQYVETSAGHAGAMLGTAEHLAGGLGAGGRVSRDKGDGVNGGGGVKEGGGVKDNGDGRGGERTRQMDGVGNAPLRLWIGERSAELKRRAGEEDQARAQEVVNEKLRGVVRRIEERGRGMVGGLGVGVGGGVGTPSRC